MVKLSRTVAAPRLQPSPALGGAGWAVLLLAELTTALAAGGIWTAATGSVGWAAPFSREPVAARVAGTGASPVMSEVDPGEGAPAAPASPIARAASARPGTDGPRGPGAAPLAATVGSEVRSRWSASAQGDKAGAIATPGPAAPQGIVSRVEPAAPDRDLTMGSIVAAVKAQATTVFPCLRTALDRGELTRGEPHKLILAWEILPGGTVAAARMVGPPHLILSSLPACVGAKMKAWRFAPSRSGAAVAGYPFGPFTIR